MRCELTDYEWKAIKPFRPNKPRGDAPCWQSALTRKEGVIVWLIVALMGSNEGFVPDLIGDRALRYAVARVFHRHRHHQPAAARHDRCHCSDFASAWCAGAMAEHAAGRVPVEIDRAARLAAIPAGENPANRGVPVAVVVISSNGEGDRSVESLEVKVPEGWAFQSDPYRGASNLAGCSGSEPVKPRNLPPA